MTNAFTLGKRAFTIAVAAATILWSVSLSASVLPLTAHADTTLSNGDLIKGSLSTVYYYYNGSRYTFPNQPTYFTWYSDFSGVMTISDNQLAGIPLAGNIVVRPGTYMIKVTSDPKTYVVDRNGVLHWVESESAAAAIFGSNWNKWIIDEPDVFFTDYDTGISWTTGAFSDGMQVASGTSTYLIWDGDKHLLSSAGMTANRLQSKFVITGSSVSLSGYTSGDDITSAVASLTDTSQQATGSVSAMGALNVSLSSSTPAGQTVPQSATGVKVMAVNLAASSSAITVTNLTFDFNGVASTSDLDSVYLYQNGARLVNGKSVNSSTRQVTFSGLSIAVAAGSTATVWVVVDVSDSLAGTSTMNFSLASADAVSSSAASVSGTFPITSNTFTLSNAATVGSVTIDKTGSLSDVTIGSKGSSIAKFTLEAADEDASVSALTLHIDKASDHSNYKLWQGSTQVATGALTSKTDLVLFTFTTPYTILDGNTKTFVVSADIGGNPGDDILTSLQNSADITAIGSKYGFGMTVTNDYGDDTSSSCASASDNCSFVSIIGGKLTFAFNGPSATNKLLIGGTKQDIFDFTITSQNAVTINEMDFSVTMSNTGDGSKANFSNFRVMKSDGTVLMGPEDLGSISSGTQTIAFTDAFDMAAGKSMDLSLVVDITDTGDAATSDTITPTLVMSSVDAEDSAGDALTVGTDIIPSSNLAGHTLSLTDSGLTINLASSPAVGTVVKGSQNVAMAGFSFKATQASDVTVSDTTFHIASDNNGEHVFDETASAADDTGLTAQNYISSCSLYGSDGSLVSGPESINSSNNVEFTGFTWTVKAGQTDKLTVNCNLPNIALANSNDDAFAVEIPAGSLPTAEDSDGNSVTPDYNSDVAQLNGTTSPSQYITVTSAGTLDVTVSSDTPTGTIIIGSSTDVSVAKYRLTSTTEGFTVSTFTLANLGDDAAVSAVSVSYLDENGNTVTQTGTLSGGQVTFDGATLWVPADDTADLTVTVDTNAVSSSGGAAAGDTIQMEFLESDHTSTEFQAVGASSGTAITQTASDTDRDANTFTLHKTKPTLSLASGSPSGLTATGVDDVLKFNIAADSHGAVDINDIVFKLTSTDKSGGDWNLCGNAGLEITAGDFTLFNTKDLSTAVSGNFRIYDSAGVACATGTGSTVLTYVEFTPTTSTTMEIAKGATETYLVQMDTTGASDGSGFEDTVRLDVPTNTTLNNGGSGLGAIATHENTVTSSASVFGSIIWTDDSQTGFFDAALVKTLPVTGGTIEF